MGKVTSAGEKRLRSQEEMGRRGSGCGGRRIKGKAGYGTGERVIAQILLCVLGHTGKILGHHKQRRTQQTGDKDRDPESGG